VARKIGDAFIRVRPDTSGFLKDADGDVGRSGHQLGNTFGTMFTRAFGMISAALVGVLAVGKGIAEVRESIGLARDLYETQSAVNVIFGEGAAKVNAYVASAATALGQTRNQALGAANTFATFGKSAGLSGQGLVDFSTKLVSLSTDLASFKNTSPEEAIQAIGAALRGESEPIRRYGVLLDDASLRNEAFALGLTHTTKNVLTPQQRVLAAQALIFKQTSDAQGDFARTSNGLANQQRITAASIAETKTKIGDLLLPAVTAVTVFFNTQLLPALESKVLPALGRFKDFIGDRIAPVIRDHVVPVLKDLGHRFNTDIVPAIRDHVIPAAQDFAHWFGEVIVPNIQNYVVPALQTIGSILTATVVPAFGALFEIAKLLVNAFDWLTGTSSAAEAVRFAIMGVVAAFVLYEAITKAVKIATAAWAVIQAILDAELTANPIGIIIVAVGALVGLIIYLATKTQFFQTVWADVWGFLKMIGGWFAGPFKDFFVNGWKLIEKAFTWDNIVRSFKSGINLLLRAWNALDFGIHIHIPSVLGLPGFGLDIDDIIPDVPYLQRGGLVDRTGLAVVHQGELVSNVRDLAKAIIEALRGGETEVRPVQNIFNLTGPSVPELAAGVSRELAWKKGV
jgi:hypothetical protein